MPLIKSASKEAIGDNIKEMEESGHPPAQAKAAALNTAREAGAHIPKPKHGMKHESHHRHKEHR